ncbi:MAG: hypothetical protein Q9218_003610 [Villophora microphyllina]
MAHWSALLILDNDRATNLGSGCVTCKAKRLKCDESKPSCQQCQKRNVTCGGYKKDFKWRAFEESTFTTKPIPSPNPSTRILRPWPMADEPLASTATSLTTAIDLPQTLDFDSSDTLGTNLASGATYSSDYRAALRPSWTSQAGPMQQYMYSTVPYPAYNDLVLHDELDHGYLQNHGPEFHSEVANSMLDDDGTLYSAATSGSTISGGASPHHMDQCPPASDFTYAGNDSSCPSLPLGASHHSAEIHPRFDIPQHDDQVEEVIRQPQAVRNDWLMQLPSPPFSQMIQPLEVATPISSIYDIPKLSSTSPELLLLRFDQQTCGILSVKDGPTENPWRTMIWPLAQDSPALYHALISMTAFHTSKNKHKMRVEGVSHMRKSIKYLANGISNGNIRMDAALATTLALAFSESWDRHISTGIQHLRGAKTMVNHALTLARRNLMTQQETARLRFLCSTFVYMDVIARLTSVDDDASDDFNFAFDASIGPSRVEHKIDPLMGCASTLFPLIGRVANLVRRVSKTTKNTINIISCANDLKSTVEAWEPPEMFEAPEDQTSNIEHSLDTAEAYRWATLLYLHQAVPEMPSKTSEELAQNALVYLLKVPLNSRAVIIQIYPLLAAGCEVTSHEDRAWVEDRWAAMMQRMLIGNLDRCWEVVKEVWDRRDAVENEKARYASSTIYPRQSDSQSLRKGPASHQQQQAAEFTSDESSFQTDSLVGERRKRVEGSEAAASMLANGLKRRSSEIIEDLDYERTVRGRLHWVGVMKDWNWEILLG